MNTDLYSCNLARIFPTFLGRPFWSAQACLRLFGAGATLREQRRQQAAALQRTQWTIVLVAAGLHCVHLWFHFPTVYAMSAALYACRLCYFLGYRQVRSNGITMSPLTDNPFAVLTAVVAPAILTNASSVLCLGTGNRMARVVDRTRVIAAELASLEGGSSEYQVRVRQLERLQLRAQLLLKALRTF